MKRWMPFFLAMLFLVYPFSLGELYGQSNEGESQPSEDVNLTESGQGGAWTASVTQAWVRRYNAPGNGDDRAHALALDSQGNVYVTGESPGSGTGGDYATRKYSPSGQLLWAKRYNGPGNDIDYAWDLALDSQGNVYVTGYSTGSGTGGDYATLKYSPSGQLLWAKRYNGPGGSNGFDDAYALALDSQGNVYVTGASWGSGTGYDYATIRYSQQ
jgi:hypothetical protein